MADVIPAGFAPAVGSDPAEDHIGPFYLNRSGARHAASRTIIEATPAQLLGPRPSAAAVKRSLRPRARQKSSRPSGLSKGGK